MPQDIEINQSLSTLPDKVWDEVVSTLEAQGGIATMELPLTLQQVHANSFDLARRALDLQAKTASATNVVVQTIAPGADSAHVTGYHSAGSTNSLSRYNAHREGFVFSDGGQLQVEGLPEFDPSMRQFSQSLHEIAQHVLLALERKLELPQNWFQQTLVPSDNCSQWHIKRFVNTYQKQQEVQTCNGGYSTQSNDKVVVDEDDDILLPMHTDPSIISVVIHDRPGTNPGAMGLQYFAATTENSNNKRMWVEVPSHGHAIATILCGSVLSHITGRNWPCVKHRVVHSPGGGADRSRMAATLFLRPQPNALLQVPPSKYLEGVTLKKTIDFHTWNSRVSKNYMKNKGTTPAPTLGTNGGKHSEENNT
jgi:isopenicillin N synthase-like dioxygenase